MADVKSHGASSEDPEKVVELSPNITYGDGEVVDDPMFKHANLEDGDEALKAFAGHEGETIVITPEMEKALLWKIDMNLMPVRLPSLQEHHCTNDWTRRYSVSYMDSITLTRRLYHMPVSWDYKQSSTSWAQTTNGCPRCFILATSRGNTRQIDCSNDCH
jgi:hypothetical protein